MNGETQTASFRHHTIRQNQPITGNGTGQTRTDITPRSRLFARIVLILTTSIGLAISAAGKRKRGSLTSFKKVVRRAEVKGHRHGFRVSGFQACS